MPGPKNSEKNKLLRSDGFSIEEPLIFPADLRCSFVLSIPRLVFTIAYVRMDKTEKGVRDFVPKYTHKTVDSIESAQRSLLVHVLQVFEPTILLKVDPANDIAESSRCCVTGGDVVSDFCGCVR